jgi:hypothetical protein
VVDVLLQKTDNGMTQKVDEGHALQTTAVCLNAGLLPMFCKRSGNPKDFYSHTGGPSLVMVPDFVFLQRMINRTSVNSVGSIREM